MSRGMAVPIVMEKLTLFSGATCCCLMDAEIFVRCSVVRLELVLAAPWPVVCEVEGELVCAPVLGDLSGEDGVTTGDLWAGEASPGAASLGIPWPVVSGFSST